MRILIKGGVWKNSEDEVLKAAVMKYGLNNWSRVASLLARKSPKQCKARWYEWLDPNVKKTEWTREEEEKLLHLAKLFPTQWRTIAPIVGRTAYQCLEHYEKLLDQAQGRDEMDENDPRRLKPGEIDPHPETKPARADPIDMDEDEKEMLSEARARLANTRGKKAKRKSREKQLEEARRLAALQKRRELKAAGVNVGKKFRRSKNIDYETEVPFEAVPPRGFHETGPEETPKTALGLSNLNLHQVEGRNRQEEEERMRKDDARKLKRLQKDNMPEAIEMINRLNDPQQLRKRTALNLPAPQLSDEDLEAIVKMGASAMELQSQSADTTTAALVQSYGETPGATPQRTPKQQNTVLMEAQDAIARNSMQTPLYGERNPSMNETDFTGALPKHSNVAITPNLVAAQARGMTPYGRTPGATPGATPAGATPARGGVGMTPATPASSAAGLRDGLALNQVEEDMAEDAMSAKMRKQQQQMQIRAQLLNLPAPSNELEISMPDIQEDDNAGEQPLEEDAADIDKRRELEMEAQREAERQKQSSAVKAELPRPLNPEFMIFKAMGDASASRVSGNSASALLQQAELLIEEEMVALIKRDTFLFPPPGAKPPKQAVEVQELPPAYLDQASALLKDELGLWEEAAGIGSVGDALSQVAFDEASCDQFVYLPKAKKFLDSKLLDASDRIDSLKHTFTLAEEQLQKDAKKAKKLEDKLNRTLGGYMAKAKTSLQKLKQAKDECDTLSVDVEVFSTLRSREEAAGASRIEEMKLTVEREKKRNAKLQARYKKLQEEQRELEEKLA
mmetsp:Transcript_21917/g.51226  ORF Transcript_21917/g.51226 Transcript_21917/m.51226 type:complete len:794 (-) Transcript_21917:77-2458(-)